VSATDSVLKVFSVTRFVFIFFFVALQPIICQGVLIIEASRSHSHTPHSVGILWANDFDERTISLTAVFVSKSNSPTRGDALLVVLRFGKYMKIGRHQPAGVGGVDAVR